MPRSFLTQRESRSTNMRHVLCHISSCFRAASLGKSGRRKLRYDVLRRNSEIFGCRKTRKVHFTIRVDILTFCLNVSRVLCTCMRVPCLRLCVCQPACVSRYRMPATACSACAGPLCSNALHLFARAFAVPARVLSRVCFLCTWSFPQLQLRPLGGIPPLNHGRAASTLTIGARHCLLWLTSFSLLASVCTAETPHLAHHPHNTPAYNYTPPHTHTLHTACQRT